MTEKSSGTLVRLRDTGRAVADPREDVRGHAVVDSGGGEIGTDADATAVRMLRVEHGGILGFGATSSFIPVDAVRAVTVEQVCIDGSAEGIAAAPSYDPELAEQDLPQRLVWLLRFRPVLDTYRHAYPALSPDPGRETRPVR